MSELYDAALKKQLTDLCALLTPFDFGIGGSCLLYHINIPVIPRDIDIVCTEQHFTDICTLLRLHYQQLPRPPHPLYRTHYFASFTPEKGLNLDVMAGIAVLQHGAETPWRFDPATTYWENGIRWMQAADWVTLYRLLNRPERVAQLQLWLSQQH